MTITVRRAGPKDAAAFARIMGDPAVYPGLMQLPYTDEQHQSYAPDPELITLKVINGELEEKAQGLLIGDLPVYQANQDNGNYDIQMPPGAGSGYLYAFNCTSKDPVLAEIFSNPKWNQAMSLALNRDEINQTINFGLSEPIQALPVHPSVSFAKPEWFTTLIEYVPISPMPSWMKSA